MHKNLKILDANSLDTTENLYLLINTLITIRIIIV